MASPSNFSFSFPKCNKVYANWLYDVIMTSPSPISTPRDQWENFIFVFAVFYVKFYESTSILLLSCIRKKFEGGSESSPSTPFGMGLSVVGNFGTVRGNKQKITMCCFCNIYSKKYKCFTIDCLRLTERYILYLFIQLLRNLWSHGGATCSKFQTNYDAIIC